ncbi:MAG TPA: hypothetical protein VIJ51_18600 [Solirubrobacteraceae bacterium]
MIGRADPTRDRAYPNRRRRPGRLRAVGLAGLIAGAPTAVVVVAPTAAGASQWSATRTATSAGNSFEPVATVGGGNRLAIGWVRQLGGQNRTEIREGTPAGGLRSAALVLDSSAHLVDSPALAFLDHRGTLAVAWRRYLDGNHRIRGSIVSPSLTAGPTAGLSGGGESAYSPTFIHSPASFETVALGWSRRTISQLANVTTAGFASPAILPGAPIFGRVAAYDGAGTQVAVSTNGAEILDSERPAGAAAFAPAKPIAAAPNAEQLTSASTPSGSVVAVWSQDGTLMASVRPAGGVFPAPVAIAPAGEDPRDITVTANSANEILVAYLPSVGGAPTGALRILRLGPGGAPVGAPITLASASVRSAPTLATDTSAAFVGWSSGGVVHVVRISPGGIVGTVRSLAGRIVGGAPTLAGMPSFGAVATWASNGRIVYSVYR